MHYKRKKTVDNKEEFFTYKPKFEKSKKSKSAIINKNNPFGKLSELRFR